MLRLLTAAFGGEVRLGALVGADVIDLNRADAGLPPSMYELICAGEPAVRQAKGTVGMIASEIPARADALRRDAIVRRADEVTILAPLPMPRRNVFCVGRNYLRHAEEGARARGEEFKPPQFPEFFTKPPTAVVGTGSSFALDPSVTERLDYEAELAILIGRRGRGITREQAYGHVFGYTIGNDMTARDQQRRHGQWFKGKSLDGSCPLGPVVIPHSELRDPHALTLRLTVNGEQRQNTSTGEMSWKVPDIVYWLSQGTALEPGDIILTGTPEGVGNGMTPPTYLTAGDVVEVDLEGFGCLRTTIVAVRAT